MFKLFKGFFIFLLVGIFVIAGCSFLGVGNYTQAAEYDFEGETVTVLIDKTPLRNWFKDTTTRMYAMPVVEGHIEYIEDEFNVNLELSPISSFDPEDMAASILAGDPDADIIQTKLGKFLPLLQEELIYPLDDILEEGDFGNYHPFFEENWDEWHTYNGWTYGVPHKEVPVSAEGIIYNKDLLEDEGLEDPYKLWKEGNWTWEKMREIAEAATMDTNGDGEIDQYGLLDNSSPRYAIVSNNGDIFREIDNKKVITIDEPEVIEGLEWHQEMFNDVIESSSRDHMIDGNAAMKKDGLWTLGIYNNDHDLDFDVKFVPYPKGPAADEHKAVYYNCRSFALPITTENPEALLELTNAIFFLTDKYEDHSEWWDGRVMGYMREIATDRETLEAAEWAMENMERMLYSDEINSQLRGFIGNKSDISSAVESYKPEAQALLDDIFQQ